MNEADLKQIVDYGLSVLESNPEALLEPLQTKGPEEAIPVFVASMIQKVTSDDPEIDAETALAAIVALYGEVGEVLLKAGVELPKDMVVALLSATVELALQMSPSLQEGANQIAQAADAAGEFDELKGSEEVIEQPTEEQGVL